MLPSLLNNSDYQMIIDYCHGRYGIPIDCWKSFDLYKRKEGLWLVNKDLSKHIPLEETEGFGLRVFSGKSFPYKITHHFVQVFLKHIDKGFVEVSEKEGDLLLKRSSFDIPSEANAPKGYYICLYKKKFIGIALKTEGSFISQVPKSLTNQLRLDLKLGQ